MPRRFVLGGLCVLVSLLAACEVPGAETAGLGVSGMPGANAPAGSVIAGVVRVFPRDTVASSPTGEALTLASLEAPVADAEVALLDAGLKPLPNAPKVKTDAGGRFELAGLPLGRTLVLEVKLPDGRALRTLIATVPGGEQVTISPATTIAAAMLLADLKDVPPAHDPRAFARLAHEIALYTTPAEFELFKEDRQLAAKVGAIAAGSKEIWDLLVALKKDVTASPAPAAEVAAQIVPVSPRPSGAATPTGLATGLPTGGLAPEQVSPSFVVVEQGDLPLPFTPTPLPPTPTPLPTSTPTATPTPAPTATPTPTPTPTPVPTPTPTPTGSFVETLAGTGTAGATDGQVATFNGPRGLALHDGKLWLADAGNNRIRVVTLGGANTATGTTTLAGGSAGLTDGTGANAQFSSPSGLAWNPSGTQLFVADSLSDRIRLVTPNGVVTTLLGADGQPLFVSRPTDLAFLDADTLYVTEYNLNRILKLDLDPNGRATATPHAGPQDGVAAFADGAGPAARFNKPTGLTIDAEGNLYVADQDNNRIRKILPDGTTSTLAGAAASGMVDGLATSIGRMTQPVDVFVGNAGEVYVADTFNNRIRKVSGITPTLSTVAGTGASTAERKDGASGQATFRGPRGLVYDPVTNRVFVADSDNNVIRVIVLRN